MSNEATIFRAYRTPREHGRALIDPNWNRLPNLITNNARVSESWNLSFAGESISQLRQQARADLLAAAIQYSSVYRNINQPDRDASIVMAGHQPELFHPGVWFKNFALSRLGQQTKSVAINLVVDNDVNQHSGVRIPVREGDRVTTTLVSYDAAQHAIPHEQSWIQDRSLFDSFASRLTQALAPLIDAPSVGDLWPHAIKAADRCGNLGCAIAGARHAMEEAIGLDTLEVPLSAAYGNRSFYSFSIDILCQIEKFQQCYNEAIADYRSAHGIRSRSHPVPELRTVGEYRETPLWIYSDSQPQRRGCFVRLTASQIEITDRADVTIMLDRSGSQSLGDQLAEKLPLGVKLRPRALITTMYARLILSDLFLHGIGGGKYDQLGDMIVSKFFNIQPSEFGVLSATYTPLAMPSGSAKSSRELVQDIRSTLFHPEQFIGSADSQTGSLLVRKQELLQSIPPRGDKKQWHQEIENINAHLSQSLGEHRHNLVSQLENTLRFERSGKTLASREYAFCVYSLDEMSEMLEKLAG